MIHSYSFAKSSNKKSLAPGSLPERSRCCVGLLSVVVFFCFITLIQACAVTSEQKKWFDRDGDGIGNNEDNCPDSTPEQVVNSQGCHLFDGVLSDVRFERNSTDLDDRARAALDELVAGLQQNPQTVIGVHAHTDNRGRARLNLDLSKDRVMSVVEYMVQQGIPARQLKPYAYGESRPLVSNATPAGREQNRRIEVVHLE